MEKKWSLKDYEKYQKFERYDPNTQIELKTDNTQIDLIRFHQLLLAKQNDTLSTKKDFEEKVKKELKE